MKTYEIATGYEIGRKVLAVVQADSKAEAFEMFDNIDNSELDVIDCLFPVAIEVQS